MTASVLDLSQSNKKRPADKNNQVDHLGGGNNSRKRKSIRRRKTKYAMARKTKYVYIN
jgi:hypothetical protein